jgi:hypothetical protein
MAKCATKGGSKAAPKTSKNGKPFEKGTKGGGKAKSGRGK